MAAARRRRRRVPCSVRIASPSFILGYAGKMHWSESDFQLVTINGAPGLLMRHPLSGDGTYSFDIADGRIRAIYVVRNPDKLSGFLEHTH
jgi:RNA polymerase sigma-70 factor (ECF subfamily)